MNADAKPDRIDPVIAVARTDDVTRAAVKALSLAGFDMGKLSIVGKGLHTDEQKACVDCTGDRVQTWGTLGGFWGAVWGLPNGPAVFTVPDFGLVAADGPFGANLIAALDKELPAGGLSGLADALSGLGLSMHQAMAYQDEVKADRFLLIVHGNPAEIARARGILAPMAHVLSSAQVPWAA